MLQRELTSSLKPARVTKLVVTSLSPDPCRPSCCPLAGLAWSLDRVPRAFSVRVTPARCFAPVLQTPALQCVTVLLKPSSAPPRLLFPSLYPDPCQPRGVVICPLSCPCWAVNDSGPSSPGLALSRCLADSHCRNETRLGPALTGGILGLRNRCVVTTAGESC